ncbi:hypothetical protein MMC25_001886 [Agyrium rufum]|nr:hypothetical protein [Agyrium rufum]
MLGTSLLELWFIRSCIFGLRYLVPIGLAPIVLVPILSSSQQRLPRAFEGYIVVELLFYLLVYLPKRQSLQEPADHPVNLDRRGRQALFERCMNTVENPEEYLVLWFCGADPREMKRGNVKEFLAWAFLNQAGWDEVEGEELEVYLDGWERKLGRKLEDGRGRTEPLRLTLDPVPMAHRPLVWYMIIALVDSVTHIKLLYHSFHHCRLPLHRTPYVFPPRPFHLLTTRASPAPHLSYYYRPHTSKTHHPVLFLHGIGIGLYPYTSFFASINSQTSPDGPTDGDIGIIALEYQPIANRLTFPALSPATFLAEIRSILAQYPDWQRFVLVTHSYSSTTAAQLFASPLFSPRIAASLIVDPVSFLLHEPNVAYNFTRRPPRRANEWQLWYFASMDPGVAHTLARKFFWRENVLWKEDFTGIKELDDPSSSPITNGNGARDGDAKRPGARRATVVLSGRDLIVDTESVARYLTGGDEGDVSGVLREKGMCRGEGLEVRWFAGLDHAQVFDGKDDVRELAGIVRQYARIQDVSDQEYLD